MLGSIGVPLTEEEVMEALTSVENACYSDTIPLKWCYVIAVLRALAQAKHEDGIASGIIEGVLIHCRKNNPQLRRMPITTSSHIGKFLKDLGLTRYMDGNVRKYQIPPSAELEELIEEYYGRRAVFLFKPPTGIFRMAESGPAPDLSPAGVPDATIIVQNTESAPHGTS